MKTILILVISISLGSQIKGQTTISGKVYDETGVGLVGANVYLEGTYDGTSTNEDGSFLLTTSEAGSRILYIDFVGFESYKKELILDGTPILIPPIELKETFNEIKAVTITAGTFEAGDKKKSVALSSIDMVTTDGSAGDVYGALQALPGTTTVGESGKLFVKGGDSRESKTFIDGMLVYVPYTSSSPNNSVRGRFSPFMFSGMMFSTGGYSAEYGQALSSVLALQTNSIEVQDQMNISLLSVGAELGGTKTWKNASLTSSLGYNNLSPYMSLVPQNRTWVRAPQSLNGDLSFRLRTARSGMLKIYATKNQSRLTTIEDNLDEPDSKYEFNLKNNNQFFNSTWIGEIKEDWILTAGISYTYNKDNIKIDSLMHEEKLKGLHAKVTLKHNLSDKVKINGGAELFSKWYGIVNRSGNNQILANYSENTFTGFVESELYASMKFITRVGARFEYSDYLKRASIAPRISMAYKMGEHDQISLSYGWFFQDPGNEFLLYSKQFEYERADHYTVNYIWQDDLRHLRTEIYFKDYKNLVKYEIDGTGQFENFSSNGSGIAYGLDLFWRDKKTIRNGEYWISYSYIEAKRNYRNYPYEAIPEYSSRHNLSLVYKHWIGGLKSQIGGNYQVSSPRFYNDPNSVEFNHEKTIPYQSLNLNWSYLHRQNVIFYASISNILGFKQQFGYEYAGTPDDNGIYQSVPKLPDAKRFFLVGCFITLSNSGNINQLDKIN